MRLWAIEFFLQLLYLSLCRPTILTPGDKGHIVEAPGPSSLRQFVVRLKAPFWRRLGTDCRLVRFSAGQRLEISSRNPWPYDMPTR